VAKLVKSFGSKIMTVYYKIKEVKRIIKDKMGLIFIFFHKKSLYSQFKKSTKRNSIDQSNKILYS